MKKSLHIWKHGLFGLAAVAGFGVVVMLLWNWLAPAIFGAAVINFWQALGLLALCRILFGSFGGRHRMFHQHHNLIHEKWMKMSDEERREFIKKRRCGRGFDRFNPDCFNGEESEKKD
jgi:hypothetical protein